MFVENNLLRLGPWLPDSMLFAAVRLLPMLLVAYLFFFLNLVDIGQYFFLDLESDLKRLVFYNRIKMKHAGTNQSGMRYQRDEKTDL